ncbi:MAG: histidine phosphatase family protein [Campylobacter sp.]|nr:histidine phosphatase family protein [Campylobacter sp.]
MKIIYFIRHAKAKKDVPSDFLRPLNKKGIVDAKALGEILNSLKISPDAIYTSSAIRALSTAKIIAEKLNLDINLVESDELYEFDGQKLLNFILNLKEGGQEIFIIGHNPAITEVCEILSDSVIGNLPTCALFAIEFNTNSFNNITQRSGKVKLYNYPQMND